MGSIVAVFIVVGIVLNLMIWLALADRVSQGNLDAPEFTGGSKDEVRCKVCEILTLLKTRSTNAAGKQTPKDYSESEPRWNE